MCFIKNAIANRKKVVGSELHSNVKTSKFIRMLSIVTDELFIVILPFSIMLTITLLSKKVSDASKVFGIMLGLTAGFFITRMLVAFAAIKCFDKACKKINDTNQCSDKGNIIEDNARSVRHKYKGDELKTDNARKYSVHKADVLGHRDTHTKLTLTMIFITPAAIVIFAFTLAYLDVTTQHCAQEISKGVAMFFSTHLIMFYLMIILIFGNCVETNNDITPINLMAGTYLILKHIKNNPVNDLFLKKYTENIVADAQPKEVPGVYSNVENIKAPETLAEQAMRTNIISNGTDNLVTKLI